MEFALHKNVTHYAGIMLDDFAILLAIYLYAQNYAGIIGSSLSCSILYDYGE